MSRLVLPVAFAGLLLASCGGGSGATTPTPPTGEPGAAPASGMYVSTQYSDAQIARHPDLTYSRRPNEGGVQYSSDLTRQDELGRDELALKLDIVVPPDATGDKPRPVVVWIHGGGFSAGSKELGRNEILGYARAGYVGVSINYRLTPDNQSSAALRLRAIRQASEDAMNAIRYLRANAATYHIDPARILTIGSSAGGGISLINAVEFDTLSGAVSDYPGFSAKVQGAVATGATLVENGVNTDSFLHFDATDSPVLMFHANATDSVTGATWTGNAVPTCKAIVDSGNSCTLIAQADMSHTVDLSLGGPYWPQLKPFLWQALGLASL